MVSWWVPYLAKGCRPDFNNGLGCDSNSDPILAPGVYLNPTRIMAPLWSYICSGLLLMVFWQVPYWPRAAGLTSIMAPGDWNSGLNWPPGVY